ncbi:copper-binding protein CusF [Opitutaceae bacterium TAV5]|nr:copper-binding protein CusF [Opitutaceae bacterium TAV5]
MKIPGAATLLLFRRHSVRQTGRSVSFALLLFAALAATPLARAGGDDERDCCAPPPAAAAIMAANAAKKAGPEPAATEPNLRGEVIAVLASRGGLLVKHEDVPGVMKAMTMLLKVDEATLAAAKKGDAITGLLVRKDDGWWIDKAKLGEPGETAAK